MGLDAIVEEIKAKGRAEADRVSGETSQEVSKIIADAQASAAKIKTAKEVVVKKEIDRMKQQELSSANLEVKKLILNAQEEILEDIVSAGQLRYRDLTEYVKIQTVEGVIAALAKTPYYPALAGYKGVLSEIENNLDKLYYSGLVKAGITSKDKLFSKFLKSEIDLKNLKILFRMKRAGMEREEIQKLLIPGGMELKESDLIRLASLSFPEFLRALEEFSYWEAIRDISSDLNSLTNIETRLDKYGILYATRISYYYPLSILPVLDYIVSKKIEVDNLRMIVRGKETNLSEDTINCLLYTS